MFHFGEKNAIEDFLRSVQADTIPHVKGKTLYDHLTAVALLLKEWNLPEHVVHAGKLHSIYSTEFFNKIVVGLDRRPEVRKVVGEKAEALIFLFCSIERATMREVKPGEFSAKLRFENDYIALTKEQYVALLHIFLANDIDHLSAFNVQQMSSVINRTYTSSYAFFCAEARLLLESFLHKTPMDYNARHFVRFIAHAGVQIKSEDSSLVVDPWLYSSNRKTPLIQGLDPESSTIDYIIPEPRNTVQDIESDVIVLSHFHTHHAPLREVRELVTFREVTIICPLLSEKKLQGIKKTLGDTLYKRINFIFISGEETVTVKRFTIRALTHSLKDHYAYMITTPETSVLHIADAATSKNFNACQFDSFWEKFHNLSPEYLFISAAGHSMRIISYKGERNIVENTTLTPVQAAKITTKINPRHVGVVGIYNFSIWDSGVEYSHSAETVEHEFYWAITYLHPGIKVLNLRPGDTFYS